MQRCSMAQIFCHKFKYFSCDPVELDKADAPTTEEASSPRP